MRNWFLTASILTGCVDDVVSRDDPDPDAVVISDFGPAPDAAPDAIVPDGAVRDDGRGGETACRVGPGERPERMRRGECLPLYPCCIGGLEIRCSETFEDACPGTLLPELLRCDTEQCPLGCHQLGCPGEQYCDESVCIDGLTCRPSDAELGVSADDPRDMCPRDAHEFEAPNDHPDDAIPLPAAAEWCDLWLCQRGARRGRGDWFRLTVPATQDLTVLVEQRYLNDRVILAAFHPQDPGLINVDFSPDSRRSVHPGRFRCLNFRGSAGAYEVLLNTAAARFREGNTAGRVDYALRVATTDLDADPSGACASLGGPPLPPCRDPADIQHCWPTFVDPSAARP